MAIDHHRLHSEVVITQCELEVLSGPCRPPSGCLVESSGAETSFKTEVSNQSQPIKSLSASSLEHSTADSRVSGPKVITVAISGCSSSGKTTLAVLLSEIFTISVNSSKRRNLLIHQDDFFLEKTDCPLTNFECTTSEDIKFCESTIKIDYVRQYRISHISIADSAQKLVRPSGFNVTGPDTDCVMAVDFSALVEHVKYAKVFGLLMDVDSKGEENVITNTYRITSNETEILKRKYNTIIAESKERVARFAKEQCTANRENRFGGSNINSPIRNVDHGSKSSMFPQFVFIDGFLLYTDLSKNKTSKATHLRCAKANAKDHGSEDADEESKHAEMATKLDKESGYLSVSAMKALMPLSDIKLFLPTSKQVARSRRSSRPEYTDFPYPGRRLPGQMWKTDGYFQHVAWENYSKQHQWLVRSDGTIQNYIVKGKASCGVEVRETVDAGVEETVKWAVEVISRKLRDMEGFSRKTMGEETPPSITEF